MGTFALDILTPTELKEMMLVSEYSERWEQFETEFSINDVDEKALKEFYSRATACGRLPDDGYDTEKLLNKLGLLKNGKLNNAGYVLIESFGSGFKRVYSLCQEENIHCTYEKSPIGFSFIFLRNDPNSKQNVPKQGKNVPIVLKRTEKLVYDLLKRQPNLTKEELALEISKTPKTVQRALDGLKEKGVIARVGTNRKGYWEVK